MKQCRKLKQTAVKQLLTLLILTAPFLAVGQTEKQIDQLKDFYSKATTNPDSLNYQAKYFDAFPSNFKEFNNVFGYFENPDPQKVEVGILYSDSWDYVGLLFRLTTIPDTLFYKKIIGIAIGGHWEADAINYFQKGLRERVFASPQLTFNILKNKSDKDIKSFFFFFFQSVHPVYKTIPKELTKMQSYNSKIYGLMEKGLDEALKQSGH